MLVLVLVPSACAGALPLALLPVLAPALVPTLVQQCISSSYYHTVRRPQWASVMTPGVPDVENRAVLSWFLVVPLPLSARCCTRLQKGFCVVRSRACLFPVVSDWVSGFP